MIEACRQFHFDKWMRHGSGYGHAVLTHVWNCLADQVPDMSVLFAQGQHTHHL